MTSIRVGDDDGIVYLFPEDQEQGFPVAVINGAIPVLVAAGCQYEIPFLFGVCADQEVRTALYEHLETELLSLIEDALLQREWGKCSAIVDLLTEADFYTKITSRRRDRAVR